MELMHIYALLYLKNAEAVHRNSLEQYFVARDHARATRRERIGRLRRRLIGGRGPGPNTVELAVP
jgi:hypothetical protein